MDVLLAANGQQYKRREVTPMRRIHALWWVCMSIAYFGFDQKQTAAQTTCSDYCNYCENLIKTWCPGSTPNCECQGDIRQCYGTDPYCTVT